MSKSMREEQVEIFLSTYNGETYLADQLESILAQSYSNILITIRDDGSTDATQLILARYVNDYPGLIRVVPASKNLGSTNSFLELLKYANSESVLFMFSDQDDVWCETKIELSWRKMQEGRMAGVVACFTDLQVVDSQLELISQSMMHRMKINPEELVKTPERLLAVNPVAGCTLMFNREVLGLVRELDFPSSGVLHDHWVALIAMSVGTVCYIPEGTILYRQHDFNQVGSLSFSFRYLLSRMQLFRSTLLRDFSVIEALKELHSFSVFRYLAFKVFYNIIRVFR